MKRHFSGKRFLRMICLLFLVGILLYICSPVPVYATERESNQTGTTDARTGRIAGTEYRQYFLDNL